ncbi:hypothetical protein J1614_011675 [Plenodomus biglobosus]|nr:hypothetical protein J1614_011675 [Plenodomus biglobosus]
MIFVSDPIPNDHQYKVLQFGVNHTLEDSTVDKVVYLDALTKFQLWCQKQPTSDKVRDKPELQEDYENSKMTRHFANMEAILKCMEPGIGEQFTITLAQQSTQQLESLDPRTLYAKGVDEKIDAQWRSKAFDPVSGQSFILSTMLGLFGDALAVAPTREQILSAQERFRD